MVDLFGIRFSTRLVRIQPHDFLCDNLGMECQSVAISTSMSRAVIQTYFDCPFCDGPHTVANFTPVFPDAWPAIWNGSLLTLPRPTSTPSLTLPTAPTGITTRSVVVPQCYAGMSAMAVRSTITERRISAFYSRVVWRVRFRYVGRTAR